MRFQDPKVEEHRNYWRIRPVVPVVQIDGSIVRKQKPFVLGRLDEMTKSQAKQRKQEIMATINAGKVTIQAQIPFAWLLQKYKDGALPLLSASTQKTYTSHIKKHIQPAFEKLKVCEIDPATVQVWMNSKLESLAWTTRHDLKKILSAIFTAAATWKIWTGDNPCESLNCGKKRMARKKEKISPEALRNFLLAIPQTGIIDADGAYLIAALAVLTGARVSEVLGYQWDDLDFRTGMAKINRGWVRGSISEGGKSEAAERSNYIGPLVEDLKAWKRKTGGSGSDWVFLRTGTKEPPDDGQLQQYIWRPAAEAVKIYYKGFGLHSFRRLHVTMKQEEGATPFEAMKMAGHSSPQMTWLYTLTDTTREKSQVDSMALKMMGKAVGRG